MSNVINGLYGTHNLLILMNIRHLWLFSNFKNRSGVTHISACPSLRPIASSYWGMLDTAHSGSPRFCEKRPESPVESTEWLVALAPARRNTMADNMSREQLMARIAELEAAASARTN